MIFLNLLKGEVKRNDLSRVQQRGCLSGIRIRIRDEGPLGG